MFVTWRVERSYAHLTADTVLIFEVSVGRDCNEPRMIGGQCFRCTAGAHHPACSHIMSGLVGLTLLQQGTISSGDVGDGEKSWGDSSRRNSFVPVSTVHNISILTDGGDLAKFTGFRPDAPPLQSAIPLYLSLLQQHSTDPAPTIIEMHTNTPIKRRSSSEPESMTTPGKRFSPT